MIGYQALPEKSFEVSMSWSLALVVSWSPWTDWIKWIQMARFESPEMIHYLFHYHDNMGQWSSYETHTKWPLASAGECTEWKFIVSTSKCNTWPKVDIFLRLVLSSSLGTFPKGCFSELLWPNYFNLCFVMFCVFFPEFYGVWKNDGMGPKKYVRFFP